MGKLFEQTKRRYVADEKVHEKILNIISHQRNVN